MAPRLSYDHVHHTGSIQGLVQDLYICPVKQPYGVVEFDMEWDTVRTVISCDDADLLPLVAFLRRVVDVHVEELLLHIHTVDRLIEEITVAVNAFSSVVV